MTHIEFSIPNQILERCENSTRAELTNHIKKLILLTKRQIWKRTHSLLFSIKIHD